MAIVALPIAAFLCQQLCRLRSFILTLDETVEPLDHYPRRELLLRHPLRRPGGLALAPYFIGINCRAIDARELEAMMRTQI